MSFMSSRLPNEKALLTSTSRPPPSRTAVSSSRVHCSPSVMSVVTQMARPPASAASLGALCGPSGLRAPTLNVDGPEEIVELDLLEHGLEHLVPRIGRGEGTGLDLDGVGDAHRHTEALSSQSLLQPVRQRRHGEPGA